MTLELDKRQFENLIKLVSLGNWLAGNAQDETIKEFDDLEQEMFAKALGAGLTDLVEKDEETDAFCPSEGLGEILESFIEEYDLHTFWSQLSDHLAARDMRTEYSEEKLKNMCTVEHFNLISKFAEKYEEEFEENGIERLRLVTD